MAAALDGRRVRLRLRHSRGESAAAPTRAAERRWQHFRCAGNSVGSDLDRLPARGCVHNLQALSISPSVQFSVREMAVYVSLDGRQTAARRTGSSGVARCRGHRRVDGCGSVARPHESRSATGCIRPHVLIVMTILLAYTRTAGAALLLGFLWPSLFLPQIEGAPEFALIALIIVVIELGHRKSMRAFPWMPAINFTEPAVPLLQRNIRIEFLKSAPSMKNSSDVGWPYLALSPKLCGKPISRGATLMLGALAGWWSFCIMEAAHDQLSAEVIVLFAVFAAGMRLAIYCAGLAPAFNLWGRIASGRTLMPGFDKVFVTPLATVAVAILGGIIIKHSGSWNPSCGICRDCGCRAGAVWRRSKLPNLAPDWTAPLPRSKPRQRE